MISTPTVCDSHWLYKLIKHSSSVLFGLVLANAVPTFPAQAATESMSPMIQELTQPDTDLPGAAQPPVSDTNITQFTPRVGPVAQPSFTVAQAITAADDGTGTVVNQTNNTFDITGGTQAGSNLFHSFEQLGLDANQVANILSNPSISNILGRVVGGDASVINGLLQVTGGNSNLFLINPAGIVFGPNAQVITPGSFAASTADAIQIGDDWFNAIGSNDYGDLVGEPGGYAFAGGEPGAVINAGNIASAGESVTLLGGVVINTGTIETPGGTINISVVPGENLVSITQGGNLLSIALPVEAQAGLNGASQGLAAESISALLSGAGMGGSLGVVVEDGVTKLVSTGTPIPTSAGTAIVSGRLDVADASANGTGGAIDVLGDRVALSDATLRASGTNGGGTVRVGGDYRGQGPVANARETFVSRDSTIDANAIVNGDGGRVIVWADDNTSFSGGVSASGGSISGNGGFVEISGKEDLLFSGNVDLSANRGSLGTLLLDPTNVSISSGDAILGASGNVIVEATNNITIAGSIEFQSSGGLITFTADSDKNGVGSFVMVDRTQSIETSGRSITIFGADITVGDISTAGRYADVIEVILTATGNIQTGGIATDSTDGFSTERTGGRVDISAGGSISIGTEISPRNIFTDDRRIRLMAGEDIVAGSLDTEGFTNTPSATLPPIEPSSVTLLATGDIKVGYVMTGAGGIIIKAGRSFRATDSRPISLDEDENENRFLDADGDEDPRLFNFSLNASPTEVDGRPSDGSIPITISYGGGMREVTNITQGAIRLLILGDNTQSFSIGPSDANPITLSTGESGTVAGIGSAGGSNATLRGQLVSQTYRPSPPPTPTPPTENNENPTQSLNASNICSNSSNNSSDNRDNPLTIDESLSPASGERSSVDVPCNDENPDSTTDSLSLIETGDESNISQTSSSILDLSISN